MEKENRQGDEKALVGGEGAWGDSYLDSVPDFAGNKNVDAAPVEAATPPEQTSGQDEWEYCQTRENGKWVEVKRLDLIDVKSEQGRYEYADASLGNQMTVAESDLASAEEDGDDQLAEEAKERVAQLQRLQTLLVNYADPSGEGGVRGSLMKHFETIKGLLARDGMDADAYFKFSQQFDDMRILMGIVDEGIARNDPDYFNEWSMKFALSDASFDSMSKVDRSKIKVDGWVGEDGHIHKAEDEYADGPDTEEAELDLREASDEEDVFEEIFKNGFAGAKEGYYWTPTFRRADFARAIDDYVQARGEELDQVKTSIGAVEKGTADYDRLAGQRKALARKRSAARRLKLKYFNTGESE